MWKDILLIIGILIYLAIGVVVAKKIDPYRGQGSGLDDIITGLLGAFWPITIVLHWIYSSSDDEKDYYDN